MNGLCEIGGWRGFVGFAADGEIAHLAFDAALVAAVAARGEALLEDFGDDGLMQRGPVLRGEWPQTGGVCGE